MQLKKSFTLKARESNCLEFVAVLRLSVVYFQKKNAVGWWPEWKEKSGDHDFYLCVGGRATDTAKPTGTHLASRSSPPPLLTSARRLLHVQDQAPQFPISKVAAFYY